MIKKLHIICFDIPYPANYGGVIDIFYKLKNLHAIGVDIILHCFEYGARKPSLELNQFCKEVHYYKRLTGLKGLDTSLPYIISSRRSKALLSNLLKDDHPILFEGMHTTYLANHPSLKDRKKILRAHNVESNYYAELATHAHKFLHKIYYAFEANRLRLYEFNFHSVDTILSISENDFAYFKKQYPLIQHKLIPAFHSKQHINIKAGLGNYCLYHGNLSVAENIKSVNFLLEEIFSKTNIPLIIAGRNPDAFLLRKQNDQIKIVANPDDETMEGLIQNAQINVLPFFQHTGLKLKLLHALFVGRHCLLNNLENESQLKNCIRIATTPDNFIQCIEELMKIEFTEDHIQQRIAELGFYDNQVHAQEIADLL